MKFRAEPMTPTVYEQGSGAAMKAPVRSGALVPLVLMLPNVVWALAPGPAAVEPPDVSWLLSLLEHVGRVGVLVVPFFHRLELDKRRARWALGGMMPALVGYYACWLRYFALGRSPELFTAPFLGVPLPMAVFPVVFLLLSSYLMSSRLMLIASIVFGVAHVWVSALSL